MPISSRKKLGEIVCGDIDDDRGEEGRDRQQGESLRQLRGGEPSLVLRAGPRR